MGCRHYGLLVDQRAAALVLGNLDVDLIRKLAVSCALAADDASLRRLDGSAADYLNDGNGREWLDHMVGEERVI